MAGPSPFFFSYAHNDTLAPHLDAFFKDLNTRVRLMTGTTTDGFRDDQKIRAGDVWSALVASELQTTPAIVCMYSPSFFNSQVCACEMQVFLERRAAYMNRQAGSLPANIIPVLWIPPLTRIPVSLPDFQYEKPKSNEFKDAGVFDVYDSGTPQEFNAIVKQVALRVKEAFKTPLPKLPYVPTLLGVESAFGPSPLPPADFDTKADSGPQCVTCVFPHSPVWKAWPFDAPDNPLLHIAAAAAKGRDLRVHQIVFDPAKVTLAAELDTVRQKNHVVVLLLDGTSLSDPTLVTRLQEVDAQGHNAAAMIAWRPGTRTPALVQAASHAFPKLSQRLAPFFNPEIDSADQFADAVVKALDTLKAVVSRKPHGIAATSSTSEFNEIPVVDATRKAA
jgi:hypothetical protein